MYNISCEAFMNFCDEMMIEDIATEGIWDKLGRYGQINPLALKREAKRAKNICKKKLNEANGVDKLYSFDQWLDKQINAVQRKINGNEIKSKKELKELQNVYIEYKKIVSSKLQ